MKLTQDAVDTLGVGEYRDDELRGLQFRVLPSGVRMFALRYTMPISGRRQRLKIGDANAMKLSAARAEAKKLISKLYVGVDPARELRRTGGVTIGDLAEKFLKAMPLSQDTIREWSRMARVDFAPISEREAATFGRSEIREWADAIRDRGAPIVANRAFAMLRRLYSWGVESGLLETTPFVALKRPTAIERKRKRALSVEELQALIIVLDQLAFEGGKAKRGQHFAAGAEHLLLTGVRLSSMIQSRRSQFFHLSRPSAAEWRIPPEFQKLRERDRRRGTATDHVVPMSRQLIALVRRRFEAIGPADFLYPRTKAARGRGKTTAWWGDRFMKKLRVRVDALLPHKASPWTIHNLRHTMTTLMEERLGISPAVTDAILGHRSEGLSESHARYSNAEHLKARREALQDWADWLDSLRWAPLRHGDGS